MQIVQNYSAREGVHSLIHFSVTLFETIFTDDIDLFQLLILN